MKLQLLLLACLWTLHQCQEEVHPVVAPNPASDASVAQPETVSEQQQQSNGTSASTTSPLTAQQSWVYYSSNNPRTSYPHAHLYRTGARTYPNRQYQQWYSQLISAQQAAAAAAAACQGQMQAVRAESEAKQQKFEQWYLNMEGHDVMFSVCGQLVPAHRLLIESSSKELGKWIDSRKGQNPLNIISLNDLVPESERYDQCPNAKLVEAFKIFLKYFYTGQSAFNGIEDLDVALMVWRMTKKYLPEPDTQMVEPKIIDTMDKDNLIRIHRFIKENDLQTLKSRWSKYVGENSGQLTESMPETMPLSCAEVESDVSLLDDFLSGMNSSQEKLIQIIRHYIEKCPESIKTVMKDASSFPNSLYFYRCTLDDLKSLVKMNFLTWENYAEELENRLLMQKHECDELIRKVSPTYYATHLRPQHSVAHPTQQQQPQQQQQQNPSPSSSSSNQSNGSGATLTAA